MHGIAHRPPCHKNHAPPRHAGGFFVQVKMSAFIRHLIPFLLMLPLFAAPAFAADAAAPLSPQKNDVPADKKAEAASGKGSEAASSGKTENASGAGQEPENASEETGKEERDDVRDAWQAIWSGQQEMLNETRETALKLSESFTEQTENLSRHLQPFEEEGRKLLVFANTFKGFPNAMEAVQRRMGATMAELDALLEPVTVARAEARSLLERVNYLSQNLPDDIMQGGMSSEMQTFVQDITRARLRLTAVLAQYDSLEPSLSIVNRLEKAYQDISNSLPRLWKNYYLQGPVAWLSPDAWTDVGENLTYSLQALKLRLPVELPTTPAQWGTAILRFCIGLIFAGVICMVLRDRWLPRDSSDISRHIFRVSLVWISIGFALLGSAFAASGNFFRFFLAVGSLCLIMGQVNLAWDLRVLQFREVRQRTSPFFRLLPLAFCAYALLYLPLTKALALVFWLVMLLAWILRLRRVKNPDLSPLQFEGGVLECDVIVLWVCLFVGVSGFYLLSMGLYLAFLSLSLAIELSLGGMAIISSVNEHLPKEGAKAILARLLLALAAPFVLVLAVVGVFLWGGVLPGGAYLLAEYAFKGVTVGATQINIIKALLIISLFYLTRTVVAMGTRFLAKLPGQGLRFDSTLITPMQTALTYAAWAIFGLFVLRSLGLELSNLAMVAGGLSVGIGFGMQTIVNNFLSGLILIFGRTLQVGDVVEVGGVTGRVRKISVRATMVETYDNAIIYVPNSEFMASRLINWTSFSRSVRREIMVGVAYGSDTSRVVKLLVDIAGAHENVLKYPAPSVIFSDFGASSLDFQLRFWVRDFELGTSTSSDLRLAIDRVFAKENIDIAFPQLDVHIKDDAPEKAAFPAARISAPSRARPRPQRRARPGRAAV